MAVLGIPVIQQSLTSYLLAGSVAYFIYAVTLAAYRLCFSPLAKFPGPRIAAATGWYEFYFDVWKNGQYIFKVEEMHRKYGPIVRINPYELSIHDPEFYNELYVTESKRRTNHYDAFCQGLDFEGSHLLTEDHDLHRMRRKPLEPFFSRQGIQKLQKLLAHVGLHLETRLREFSGSQKPVRLDHAFSAFAGDIIGRICLDPDDQGSKFLDHPDFAPEWFTLIRSIIRSIPLFSAFPLMIKLVSYLPERLLLWAYPRGQMFNIFKAQAKRRIRQAISEGCDKERNEFSLFYHIANSNMPESQKSEERLAREAQLLLGAGSATTHHTLTFASFYILTEPEIKNKLQKELQGTMAEWPRHVPTWAELERLPFLQAIIKESLRLSYGFMHRLPRISPDVPITYKDYIIPTGIPVGMSAYFMHTDPEVYPSPDRFIPDRWIGDIDPRMNRSYVPFSRGSRNCLGQNLAMAEMSLALAILYRPGGPDLELYQTDEGDVKSLHDFALPLPRLNSKGVQVLVC